MFLFLRACCKEIYLLFSGLSDLTLHSFDGAVILEKKQNICTWILSEGSVDPVASDPRTAPVLPAQPSNLDSPVAAYLSLSPLPFKLLPWNIHVQITTSSGAVEERFLFPMHTPAPSFQSYTYYTTDRKSVV